MSRPRLGQHFLADEGVLARLVEHIDPRPDDVFIEIGPGRGALTLPAARRRRPGDGCRARRLAGARPAGGARGAAAARLEVVHGDAARPWPVPAAGPWRLAGNIPYAISSPVIEQLLALAPPGPSTSICCCSWNSRGAWSPLPAARTTAG